MPNERQQRQVRCVAQQFQTRSANDDLFIEGYFSVFNSEYPLWEGASEIVKPGAFTNSVSGDVRALINHDSSLVLGRTKAGTLTLRQDERGLWGSIRINRDDVDAMNLYARVQRGDVDQNDVLDFTGEDRALDGRTESYALVGGDVFGRLFAELFGHEFGDLRHTGGSTHQQHAVDLVFGELGIFHRL